ncbi:MAG: DNA recombination protein RmuC, partial [Bacteroidales bacterium]|nr:DNA recombination protein RmuC [Bacteroidales bacterium]
KLLNRVDEFMKRYEEIGKKIDSLQNSYEDTKKKLYTGNQSVVKAANKIAQISGIKNDDLNQLSDF